MTQQLAADDRRIAIVGMAFRFPGADCEPDFWQNLRNRVSHVRRFSTAELAAAGVAEEEYRSPDFVGASGLLPGIGDFDASFFGMSPNTAKVTDPQHRLFLEFVTSPNSDRASPVSVLRAPNCSPRDRCSRTSSATNAGSCPKSKVPKPMVMST